jgi:hypothetical protein
MYERYKYSSTSVQNSYIHVPCTTTSCVVICFWVVWRTSTIYSTILRLLVRTSCLTTGNSELHNMYLVVSCVKIRYVLVSAVQKFIYFLFFIAPQLSTRVIAVEARATSTKLAVTTAGPVGWYLVLQVLEGQIATAHTTTAFTFELKLKTLSSSDI